jgi:hypothetical protein
MNCANDQHALLHRVFFSPSCLVRSVSWHNVGYGKYDSPLGANALYCCNRFDRSHDLFMLNLVDLNNSFFYKWHKNNLTAWSLLDIIFIREGYRLLPDNFTLTKSEITDIIAGKHIVTTTEHCTAILRSLFCCFVLCVRLKII